MNRLLSLTAIIEAATGLGLLVMPTVVVKLLLGADISGAGLPLGRVAGGALLALGVACWRARKDEHNRATAGIISAMLFYNVSTTAVLAWARFGSGLSGIGLWPAVILHACLAGWCVALL
jgi:hypothetical protein